MTNVLSRVKKTTIGAVAAVTIVGGSIATSTLPAEAGGRHHYRDHGSRNGAIAAGVIGGLALGAIASQSYGYGTPAYGYGGPVYVAPGYGADCWTKRVVRHNRFGERVVRVVRTCQ